MVIGWYCSCMNAYFCSCLLVFLAEENSCIHAFQGLDGNRGRSVGSSLHEHHWFSSRMILLVPLHLNFLYWQNSILGQIKLLHYSFQREISMTCNILVLAQVYNLKLKLRVNVVDFQNCYRYTAFEFSRLEFGYFSSVHVEP